MERIMVFVSERQTAPLAKLSFYNNLSIPILDMKEDIKLKCAPYNPQGPNYDEECIIVERNKGYEGIFTTNISECHALALVERDEQGEIKKIAMQHFPGGLTKEQLEEFLKHCNNKKGFSGHLELVHYPGCHAKSGMDKKIEAVLQEKTFDSPCTIQRIYHADPSSSCCVMFNGKMGKADFAPKNILEAKVTECKLNISSLIEKNARDYFHQLIIDSSGNKQALLNDLMSKILNDSTLNNPEELLEKTRQLIVNAECFPEQKQQFYDEYTQELNNQPSLSNTTKIACAVLCATLIGIIPALIIAHHYKSAVKELRSEQLGLLDDSLDIFSRASPQ
jgi:hypothetical protein